MNLLIFRWFQKKRYQICKSQIVSPGDIDCLFVSMNGRCNVAGTVVTVPQIVPSSIDFLLNGAFNTS